MYLTITKMSYISSRRINFQIQQNRIFENRVNKSIEDLTKIQPFMPTQDFDFKTKEIQSNISEERFIEMIQYFKEKITEGDMFELPSRIYKYAHHAGQDLQSTFVSTVSKFKTTKPKSIYVLCAVSIDRILSELVLPKVS